MSSKPPQQIVSATSTRPESIETPRLTIPTNRESGERDKDLGCRRKSEGEGFDGEAAKDMYGVARTVAPSALVIMLGKNVDQS